MSQGNNQNRKLYVGMHDGVCVVTSSDGGRTWEQGKVTPLAHAASRLTVSPTEPQRAYLAAYETGVYRTDDGGHTWQVLSAYPSDYAHGVLVHPEDSQMVYVGVSLRQYFAPAMEEGPGMSVLAFRRCRSQTSGSSTPRAVTPCSRPPHSSPRPPLPICGHRGRGCGKLSRWWRKLATVAWYQYRRPPRQPQQCSTAKGLRGNRR